MNTSPPPPGPVASRSVPAPGPVLLPGAPFSAGELAAMLADGIVQRPLLDAHLRTGVALTRATKVLLLTALLPGHLQRRGVLGRMGAAWFYDCAPAPYPVPILVSKDARTTTTLPPGFSLHQTGFHPYDRVRHEAITVTTPLRTAVDLALHVPGADATAALQRLLAAPHLHCPPQLVHSALDALGKAPGRRRAMARVRKLGRGVERGYDTTGR